MSGRITLHLDQGLGWTKPLAVACCADCGIELARHLNPDRALGAARRCRCPACGTRSARRLPGTTSVTADLALVHGRQPLRRRRWPPARRSTPNLQEGGECPACLPPRRG